MFVFDNNVVTSLFGAVSIGASSITINKASAPFRDPPDPSGSVGIVTIVDSITAPTKIEIISYTGRTDNGATFTLTGVSKGQDGTTDQAWNNGDTVIQAVTAAAVTELQTALDDKANTTGTYASLRAQATTKDDVGLGSVDNVSAASLRDRATHTGSQAIGTITGLQTELNNKANAIGTYANLRAQATTKADVGLGSVDNVSAASLRDRSTHTGTQPPSSISVTQNSLLIGGASNLGSTIASGAFGRTLIGAADAISARTSLQLGSSALTGVKNSVQIDAGNIQLVGDSASPGNARYYGTDGSGTKGFYELPSAGDVQPGQIIYSPTPLTTAEGYLPCDGEAYLRSAWPAIEASFKGPFGSYEEVDLGVTTYGRVCYAGNGHLIFYSNTSPNVFRCDGGDPTDAANYDVIATGLNVRAIWADGNGLVLASDGNHVVRSTNYGATWSGSIYNPTTGGTDATLVGDGHGTILLSIRSSSAVAQSYTTNDGDTWTNVGNRANINRAAYAGVPGVFVLTRSSFGNIIELVDANFNSLSTNWISLDQLMSGTSAGECFHVGGRYYLFSTSTGYPMAVGVGTTSLIASVTQLGAIPGGVELHEVFGYPYCISSPPSESGQTALNLFSHAHFNFKTLRLDRLFSTTRANLVTTPSYASIALMVSDLSLWHATTSGRYWNVYRPDPTKFVTPYLGNNYYIKAE